MARLPEDPDRILLTPDDVAMMLDEPFDEQDPDSLGPNVSGAGTSGGVRPNTVNASESRRRREAMSRLLAAGASTDLIIETFTKVVMDDGSPGFNMLEGSITRLMDECRSAWGDEDRERAKYVKSAAVRRHHRHIAAASKKGAFSAVAMLEKNLAQIEGTMVHRVEIGGDARITDMLMRVLGEVDPEDAKRMIAEEARLSEMPRALPAGQQVFIPPKADPAKARRARSALDALGLPLKRKV